jgi:hypothetical protein
MWEFPQVAVSKEYKLRLWLQPEWKTHHHVLQHPQTDKSMKERRQYAND